MINIKIYCNKKHQEYQSTYETLNNVMVKNHLDFTITRISEPKAIALQHIAYEPHIVINNQVVYTKHNPTEKELMTILSRLGLIKGLA